jgi:CheY-like chemotaxis protein
MENMLRRLIGENVQLVTALEPELGHVTADAGQIEQVIMNLVVNARDAIHGVGTITIRTSNDRVPEAVHLPKMKSGNCVSISVSDDGAGMDEETQKHIFEPFFTTKKIGEGTGLGLSMVWGIVNQSGGHVDVVSEAGRGTTFTVYLPKAQGRGATESATEPDPIQTGTETLLLVEDRLDVRALTAEILRGCGYKVLETEGPGEALALWQSRRDEIDLIITDVVMPEMTGPELVSRLKALREDIKVLYVSGHTSSSVLGEKALSDGSAFLEKPFSPRKLASAVHALLAASAKRVA